MCYRIIVYICTRYYTLYMCKWIKVHHKRCRMDTWSTVVYFQFKIGEDLIMHHSKRLAILLAVSLFMGSIVGTSAMAAETVEEVTNTVSEKDISSVISEDESAAEETAAAEETEVVVPDDNEEETGADQEAVSDNRESVDHNDDTIDVQRMKKSRKRLTWILKIKQGRNF